MTKKRIIFFITFLFALNLSAQNDSLKNYTLDETVIKGFATNGTLKNRRYSPGNYSHHFAVASSEVTPSNSLADFIKEQTALYIKEYGHGGSAYLSLRGTSSSHTSIYWNGQDMSIPTMGQTDLSHIPLYFYDNLEISLGGNSSLYGNGSFGGNLSLETNPKWEKGLSGDISISGGSYSNLFCGSTLRWSGQRWESRTSALYQGAKNNYCFKNNTKPGLPYDRLNNAAYRNYGVLQELFRKFRDNSLLSVSICYLDFNRQIQPSASNNERPENYSSIFDNNLKIAASYAGSRNEKWFYNTILSYAFDHEQFEEDIISAARYANSIEGEYKINRFSLKVGNSFKYTVPSVYAYKAGVQEVMNELYLFAKWIPFKKLSVAAGLRYTVVTDTEVPLMPSFNAKYTLFESIKSELSLRGSTAISTKIPTLNDRYWGGTYTLLKPEVSYNMEAGVDYSYSNEGWNIKTFANGYRALVKNWIRWLPVGTIWRPQNIAKVLSYGAETGISVEKNISKWKLSLNSLYSLTFVEMKESHRDNDPALNHQLAYQPYNTISSFIGASNANLSVRLSLQVVGTRTTTDIYDTLPAYSLLDLSVRYKFSILSQEMVIGGELKNILNTHYQSVKFYAMPGINYLLSIKYIF